MLVLHNLHPRMPELVTQLPGLRVDVGLLRQTAMGLVPEAVAMHLDTVTVLPDEDELVLVWRGVAPVRAKAFDEELVWVECEIVPLDAPRHPGLHDGCSPATWARRRRTRPGARRTCRRCWRTCARCWRRPNLPPEVMKVVETEDDPDVLTSVLNDYLATMMATLKAKYPEAAAAAGIPPLQ
ncbi:MAG: DUF2169 domain-containing protein [Acetobacteraceae bacterium]